MEHRPTQSSSATGRAQGTIFIEDWLGRVGTLDVCWEDTGMDLKRRVIQKFVFNSDVDRLKLIFADKQLEDARSLRHQGLMSHCVGPAPAPEFSALLRILHSLAMAKPPESFLTDQHSQERHSSTI
ncbi:hypothetical protein KIL84_009286 [Mauremys mutica]|uniref:Uncharacterized protein n=1 Tax=Mauremys mutica TaxID=74926 RepID=A0A9D4B503_9SAUR|nr:hypothetical protein KIL84_009286 [Mauremys mutica]